jgi:hypothetical protein
LVLVQADPVLSRHLRTITFDIRGEHRFARGVTDLCDEVVALLDYLAVEKTHVLGTSLGGFVARSWRWRGRIWWIGWRWSARATAASGVSPSLSRRSEGCSGGAP